MSGMLKLLAGAGSAASAKLYPEDVFATHLYTGNGATQTINNGIDLAGKGGMVWQKWRDASSDHWLIDTERGVRQSLSTNDTVAQQNKGVNSLTAFTSSGFTVGSYFGIHPISTWTFRKAPKFFDIVTYTGDGVAGRQIPHNLGCEVGMIIVKKTSDTSGWCVYHRSNGTGAYMQMNLSDAKNTYAYAFPSVTSTYFQPQQDGNFEGNINGQNYVAYLYAHDTSADGIIQCGSCSGTSGTTVTLGWEPQYILVKDSTTAGTAWNIMDVNRGMSETGTSRIFPNLSNAESATTPVYWVPTSTGFKIVGSLSSGTYIYMAIRRPMKVPTSGTEVFAMDTLGGTLPNPPGFNSGFPVDMSIRQRKDGGDSIKCSARIIQGKQLYTNLAIAEATNAEQKYDYMNGFSSETDTASNHFAWMFKRAKGFFDVVCYTGTGVARTVNHNLGVVPELMIVKRRNLAELWATWHTVIGTTNKYLAINETSALQNEVGTFWNTTLPTSSAFSLGSGVEVNGSTSTYVCYLFSSLPGVSKVGSYTGNGSSINLDMGFATGCRFFLCKRTDSTGDWMVADTIRGITAGADNRLSLNTTAAEVTTDDWCDSYAQGLTVNQTAASNANVLNATYIYLAIA